MTGRNPIANNKPERMNLMEFKDFQYLTHGDPVTFLLAWNMLLENGRVSLREHDVSDLAAGLQVRMSNFMTEEKTRSVAETAKGLAELEPSLILHVLQRASHIITLPGEPQEGQCPVCGGGLKYQTPVVDGHEVRRRYRCEDCAATGEEVLHWTCVGHTNVHTADGEPLSPSGSEA